MKSLERNVHQEKDCKMMTDGINKILVHKYYWGDFIDICFWFSYKKNYI